jgi:uncharacterized protein
MGDMETVRAFYERAAQGDLDGIAALLAPDVDWCQTPGWPDADRFRSPSEVLAGVFGKLHDEWDGFKGVPSEFLDAGEAIVVLGAYSGTCKATGRSFEAPFAHVFRVRDGVVAEMTQYADTKLVHDAWR